MKPAAARGKGVAAAPKEAPPAARPVFTVALASPPAKGVPANLAARATPRVRPLPVKPAAPAEGMSTSEQPLGSSVLALDAPLHADDLAASSAAPGTAAYFDASLASMGSTRTLIASATGSSAAASAARIDLGGLTSPRTGPPVAHPSASSSSSSGAHAVAIPAQAVRQLLAATQLFAALQRVRMRRLSAAFRQWRAVRIDGAWRARLRALCVRYGADKLHLLHAGHAAAAEADALRGAFSAWREATRVAAAGEACERAKLLQQVAADEAVAAGLAMEREAGAAARDKKLLLLAAAFQTWRDSKHLHASRLEVARLTTQLAEARGARARDAAAVVAAESGKAARGAAWVAATSGLLDQLESTLAAAASVGVHVGPHGEEEEEEAAEVDEGGGDGSPSELPPGSGASTRSARRRSRSGASPASTATPGTTPGRQPFWAPQGVVAAVADGGGGLPSTSWYLSETEEDVRSMVQALQASGYGGSFVAPAAGVATPLGGGAAAGVPVSSGLRQAGALGSAPASAREHGADYGVDGYYRFESGPAQGGEGEDDDGEGGGGPGSQAWWLASGSPQQQHHHAGSSSSSGLASYRGAGVGLASRAHLTHSPY